MQKGPVRYLAGHRHIQNIEGCIDAVESALIDNE